MSPAADPPLSSFAGGTDVPRRGTLPSPRPRWEALGRWHGWGTAGINPALSPTWRSPEFAHSRGGQMSPAADPPLSSATLGGAWKVARLGDGRNKSGLKPHLALP